MRPLEPMDVALDGTTLIEASAGTGKTYTLTTLYLRLLLERKLSVSQILVVTYTRAATAELRDRVRQRLSEAHHALQGDVALDDPVLTDLCKAFSEPDAREEAIGLVALALAGFDEAAIFTIHGFCQRVLQQYAFESGSPYDLDVLTDEGALLGEIARDYWDRSLVDASDLFVRWLHRTKRSPETLLRLVRRSLGNPRMAILPSDAPPAEIEASEAAWRDALDALRGGWARDRDAVLELLVRAADEKHLHKGSYAPAKIAAQWGPEMDGSLAEGAPGLATDCKPFARFTTENLTKRTNKDGTTPSHDFFGLCDDFAEADAALEAALQREWLGLQLGTIAYAREEAHRRKHAQGSYSFDDLLVRLAEALSGPRGEDLVRLVRREFRAALIDEFQDTDAIQYETFRRIWHAASRGDDGPSEVSGETPALFLIGDPKQAIYGFRGADVQAYLDAKQDAADRSYTLTTNWRSDPSTVRAVNTLFGRAQEPFLLEGIPFEPVSASRREDRLQSGSGAGALELVVYGPEDGDDKPVTKARARTDITQQIAAEVSQLLSSGESIEGAPISPGDIAILCRSNDQAQAMREALAALRVPAALLGESSVFDSDEARELEWLLHAMVSPDDARAVRLALTTHVLGLRGEAIDAFQQDDPSVQDAWEKWLDSFQRWHASWFDVGFIQAFHQMLDEAAVHARLLALPDGERRLTNLLHLAELAQSAAREGHLGPALLVQWLHRIRNDASLREGWAGDAAQLRLESDLDAVKVSTMHRSKGLEYPIVYCPFLWDGKQLFEDEKTWIRFHDEEHGSRLSLDVGSERHAAHLEAATRESLAERLRLLYVALTRAKHRCIVVWGRIKEAETSALAYLLHQPQEESSADLVAAVTERVAGLDSGQLRAELEALAHESEGSIVVRGLRSEPGRAYADDDRKRTLARRSARRRLATRWRHSSFSALTRRAARAPHRSDDPVEEGRDFDALRDAADPLALVDASREIRLRDFPKGAAAGTLIHEILELLDFQEPGSMPELVESALAQAGLPVDLRDVLCEALGEVLQTPWSGGSDAPSLAAIPRAQRLDELEFLIPVAPAASADLAFTVDALADVFSSHAASDAIRDYGESLRSLRFHPLEGFLRGFIDLAFEWNGRFHVVDYKSNHLGPQVDHYADDALRDAMWEHHYVLQYHLYLVALHRYLGQRLPDYDYDTHIGGAWYLFLRGMAPGHPPGRGVYHDRPPAALIEALSDRLSKAPSAPAGTARGGAR